MYDGQRRRAADSLTEEEKIEQDASFRMCPAYASHVSAVMIHEDLQKIIEAQHAQSAIQQAQAIELKKMAEMMEAWNNAKGFVKTMRTIGEIMKWVAAVIAAGGLIWYFLWGKR